MSVAEYGRRSAGAGTVPARMAVTKRLATYHRALLNVATSDADIIFQRALEKLRWSSITGAFDELPPVEQRLFAVLALIDDGREQITLQQKRLRALPEGVRRTVSAGQHLGSLRADQTRREERLKTLLRQLEAHWRCLT